MLKAGTKFALIPNLMQDNPRLHHLEQPEDLDLPLSRDFKENALLLIIIVCSKQTQPGAI